MGMKTIVGKCSLCGGVVSTPRVWMGINRPPVRCESCGASADETAGLPVVPMKPLKEAMYTNVLRGR